MSPTSEIFWRGDPKFGYRPDRFPKGGREEDMLEFKNNPQHRRSFALELVRILLAFVAIAAFALLFTRPSLGEPTREPTRTRDPIVAEMLDRLEQRRDYVAEHDEEMAERSARWERENRRRTDEAGALAKSMRAHLRDSLPGNSDAIAKRLEVDTFAFLIVDEVNRREQEGRWLPLGRRKAPYFLASVSFHESGWRWRDPGLKGSRGEGCAFQVAPATSKLIGYNPDRVAREPSLCVRAAVDAMEHCSRMCGDVPAEGWMGCYGTGRCGEAPDVVEKRFALARRLLGK